MIVASQLQPTDAVYREVIPAGDYWMRAFAGMTYRVEGTRTDS